MRREGKIFVADGAYQIAQGLLVGGAAVREQQPFVGDQQHLTGAGRQHGHRAGKAGTAQYVAEHAARLHAGDGDAGTLRAGAVGFQLAGQHNTDPVVRLARKHKGFALAVTADHGTQLGEQGLQFFGRETGK